MHTYTLLQDGGSILRRLSLAPTVWLLSTLVALFVSLLFGGLHAPLVLRKRMFVR